MMRVIQELNLQTSGLVVGKHSIWWPAEQVKIPFQWGGQVQKYQKPAEASYSLDTIAEEVALLRWLASKNAAPFIGDWVYVKTLTSGHLGPIWTDPCGAYGYEMAAVNTMDGPGIFSVEWLRETGLVSGSVGAWSDLSVPERGNIVNGYCIDVRRSGFDCLRFLGAIAPMPRFADDRDELQRDLRREGSFPFKERPLPYQEYWLDGEWCAAEREVRHRAELLTFEPGVGDTVVDLGCCLGGFLQYAKLAGADRCIGIDMQPAYVDLARRLARAGGMNICYRTHSLSLLERSGVFLAWLKSLLRDGRPDHLLCLSMGKHLTDEIMWEWIDALNPRRLYLETNAINKDAPCDSWHYWPEVMRRDGQFLGLSTDRNTRALYKIVMP